MPPQLALALCIVFVLTLLRIEARRSAGVSSVLWIPSIWLMALASKPMGIWFGNTGDLESGSPLDRLLLTTLGLAGIAVLVRRRFDWAGVLRRHGWLLALLGYMLVSTLWSEIPAVALKRWGRQLIVLIMALVVVSQSDPRASLESVVRRAAYVLIPFSLLLIKYFPHFGVEYARWSGKQMWIGVTVHKNTLGCLCLISAFFVLWTLYRRWREPRARGTAYLAWADVSVLLIALFLLRGAENAYSATALGTFAIGALLFVVLVGTRRMGSRVPHAALLVLLLAVMVVGVSAPFLGGSNLASFSSAFGRDETLTGRTETWLRLTPEVERQPLLGVGFGSFWTTSRREFYQMSHGHNGYLDTLLELGWVGMLLSGAWLLSCTSKLHGALADDFEWASLGLCFVVMAATYNVTESVLSTLAEEIMAILVLTSLVVPLPRKLSQAVSRRTRVSRAGRTGLAEGWARASR